MRKYKTYLAIFFALLVILCLPIVFIKNIRERTVSFFSQSIFQLKPIKNALNGSEESHPLSKENEFLRIENLQLKAEVSKLQDLLEHELLIERDLLQMQMITESHLNNDVAFQRRYEELRNNVELKVEAIPAEVIFRGNSTWDNTFWINVGNETNERLGRLVVAKNSPVIIRNAVVGLIDYVGKHQSLVRLITDPGLHPSVRVARGFMENRYLMKSIDEILKALQNRSDLFGNSKDNEILSQNLQILKRNISPVISGTYLAKGDLCGACRAKNRSLGYILKGSGFNYDYDDDEGPARDLRTGKTSISSKVPPAPIIQVGDLLVTTGMDGIFPSGLDVAEVTSIDVLKEGGFAYDIEALAVVGNLAEIRRVFVLPPVGFDPAQK